MVSLEVHLYEPVPPDAVNCCNRLPIITKFSGDMVIVSLETDPVGYVGPNGFLSAPLLLQPYKSKAPSRQPTVFIKKFFLVSSLILIDICNRIKEKKG